jgi:hypothetical protein
MDKRVVLPNIGELTSKQRRVGQPSFKAPHPTLLPSPPIPHNITEGMDEERPQKKKRHDKRVVLPNIGELTSKQRRVGQPST